MIISLSCERLFFFGNKKVVENQSKKKVFMIYGY